MNKNRLEAFSDGVIAIIITIAIISFDISTMLLVQLVLLLLMVDITTVT